MQDVSMQKIWAPILKPCTIFHACSGNFHLLAVLTGFKLRFSTTFPAFILLLILYLEGRKCA